MVRCQGCARLVTEGGFIIVEWVDVLCFTCWRLDPRRQGVDVR